MSTPTNFRVVVHLSQPPMVDVLSDECVDTWLPVLGPTAMLLAQRFVIDGDGSYVTAELARQFGVGTGRLWQAVTRLEKRQLVTVHPEQSGSIVNIHDHWPNPPFWMAKP